MEITIRVDDDNLVKVQVENDEYRFVKGSEENMVVSSKGEILMRFCKSRGPGINEKKDYYEVVTPSVLNGYFMVGIPVRKVTRPVHRIVAETFIEKPEGYGKVEVDHINRNRQDNRVENLRWVTHKENMSNISKYTKYTTKTYYRDITAKDLSTGKEYFFKKISDIVSLAQERHWGQGWGYRLRKLLKQDDGGIAYGFHWSARVKKTVNIR